MTHWGRVTHICVSKLTIIGSGFGLSPGRRQAIIWTNAGILLIRTLGTNFSEILSENHAFWFKKMHLKMSSAKWRPFCLGLNVLKSHYRSQITTLIVSFLFGRWFSYPNGHHLYRIAASNFRHNSFEFINKIRISITNEFELFHNENFLYIIHKKNNNCQLLVN